MWAGPCSAKSPQALGPNAALLPCPLPSPCLLLPHHWPCYSAKAPQQGHICPVSLQCPTKLPAEGTGAIFLEQAQGNQAELTTKHGAEWDPGAQPAPHIHLPAPCPCASPSWGTSCPCRGRGGCRLADGHQGSVPLFQYSQDTAIRPGAQIGEGAGALPTLSGEGSGERTQSHAGPAKLRCRALG